MNERIRKIREMQHMTRAEFGKTLGVSGDVINNWERGRVEIKESHIMLLCNTYNISEEWLRNGTGDMIIKTSHKEKTVRFMADVAKLNGLDPEGGLIARMIDFLSDMSVEEWKMIATLAERWYQIEKAARDPEDGSGRD